MGISLLIIISLFSLLLVTFSSNCAGYSSVNDCSDSLCIWEKESESNSFSCQSLKELFTQSSFSKRRELSRKILPVRQQENYFKCKQPEIHQLQDNYCYANFGISLDECSCAEPGESTYVIPKVSQNIQDDVLNKLVFVFIHVNKAAGETIRNIFFHSCKQNGWDGAGYATREGWQYLEQPTSSSLVPQTSQSLRYSEAERGKVMYTTCGKHYSTFQQVSDFVYQEGFPLSQARNCSLQFIWGNAGMGLCDHFPGKPYGAEGRKKWTKDMLKKGECDIGPYEWFRSMKTSPFFYIERLTRGCDKNCGVQAAIANLLHPCLRYIIVEKFNDGLAKLKQKFNPLLTHAIDEYFQSPKRLNRRGQGTNFSQLKYRSISNSTIEKLKEWLKDDYLVYNEAIKRYEEQWNLPLTSCSG